MQFRAAKILAIIYLSLHMFTWQYFTKLRRRNTWQKAVVAVTEGHTSLLRFVGSVARKNERPMSTRVPLAQAEERFQGENNTVAATHVRAPFVENLPIEATLLPRTVCCGL